MWAPIWVVSIKSFNFTATMSQIQNFWTFSKWLPMNRFKWWKSVRHANRYMWAPTIVSNRSIWPCVIDDMTVVSVALRTRIAAGTKTQMFAGHMNWDCCRWGLEVILEKVGIFNVIDFSTGCRQWYIRYMRFECAEEESHYHVRTECSSWMFRQDTGSFEKSTSHMVSSF